MTVKDMETDIVYGLEAGADDYITKPFTLMVLRARVDALLRRSVPRGESNSSTFKQDGFEFDFQNMVFVKDGKKFELTKAEQKLLYILVLNKNNIVSRDTLIDRIWTDGSEYVDENALSVTVKRLRDKVERVSSQPEYIKTIYGLGYRWESR